MAVKAVMRGPRRSLAQMVIAVRLVRRACWDRMASPVRIIALLRAAKAVRVSAIRPVPAVRVVRVVPILAARAVAVRDRRLSVMAGGRKLWLVSVARPLRFL